MSEGVMGAPKMRDIPIIFSAPMIQALLAGRKTMTRRLAWGDEKKGALVKIGCRPSPWQRVRIGDRLWVRESYAQNDDQLSDDRTSTSIVYAADGAGRALDNGSPKPWRPSIHMPRAASRLTLVVTGTKIERLQEISDQECKLEGIECAIHALRYGEHRYRIYGLKSAFTSYPRKSFESLWCSLHGAESWAANPEVVAISFTVHRCNIDALPMEGLSCATQDCQRAARLRSTVSR